jgi:hypothetical protein
MFIPRQYKGEIQNYFGDIAILVTHKTFVLSARVQPVCVDWGFKYDNALFDPTRKIFGHVSLDLNLLNDKEIMTCTGERLGLHN